LEGEYAAGQARDTKALMERIVQVSLESHVLSRFTAYVAVDKSDVVNPGGRPQEIVQPVEFPDGWESRAMGLGALPPSTRRSSHVLCDAISPVFAASPDLDDDSCAFFDMDIDEAVPCAGGGAYHARARQMLSRLSPQRGESPASPPRDTAKSTDETHVAIAPDLDRVLKEAIHLGASEISIALDRKRIRIRFLISGKWTVHASSLPASWDELLEVLKRRAGIDPTSMSWPQHGVIHWQDFALPVVVIRARKHETVSIQIPPGAAGTEVSTDAEPTAAEKRTRFWTC
jgi:type II secretory ATPase GspE/PulE/Tfp pilus assembly ATPase PilB-like protein